MKKLTRRTCDLPHFLEYPEMILDGHSIYIDRPLHLVSRVSIFYDSQPITDEIRKDVESVIRQQILDLLGDYGDLALSEVKWSQRLENTPARWDHKYNYYLRIQARVTLEVDKLLDLDAFVARLESSVREASNSMATINISHFTDFDVEQVLARYGLFLVDYQSVH